MSEGGKTRPKYLHEKHPKLMKESPVKEEEKGIHIQKERHSSGESQDSSMSVSPFDSIRLEEGGAKTEESETEEEDTPRYTCLYISIFQNKYINIIYCKCF